jgi:hypothetical protein
MPIDPGALQPMSLYRLSDAHRLLMDEIAAGDGEVTPEQGAALDALEGTIAGKVDAICEMRAAHRDAAAAIAAEITRLGVAKRHHDQAVGRFDRYLGECLERAGRERVDTTLHRVRVQDSPPAVRWTREPDQIPAEFRREVPATCELDVRAVLRHVRGGGAAPPGVEIVRGRHLVIS